MSHRTALKLAVLALAVAGAVKVTVTIAQQRVQVGVPECEVFSDLGGTRCAATKCDAPGTDSFGNYNDCTPDPRTQSKQV